MEAEAEKAAMGERVTQALEQCRAVRAPFEERIAALEEELIVTRERVEEEVRTCRAAEAKLAEQQQQQ